MEDRAIPNRAPFNGGDAVTVPSAPSWLVEATMRAVVGIVDGCDGVTVLRIGDSGMALEGASDPAVEWIQLAEIAATSGPSTQAVRAGLPVQRVELLTDDRWPKLATEAMRSGYRLLLSNPLTANGRVHGVLNLWSTRTDAFRGDDQRRARVFASHLAVGLEEHRIDQAELTQMRTAVRTRTAVDQATGVFMERHRITETMALSRLRQLAQEYDVPVYEMAVVILSAEGTT